MAYFTIHPPVHDPVKQCFTIKVVNPPIFTTVDMTPEFIAFINAFLSMASRYFSRPLDQALFLKRLVNIFSETEEAKEAEEAEESADGGGSEESTRIRWFPDKILFYKTRYEIHWLPLYVQEKETVEDKHIDTLETAVTLPSETNPGLDVTKEDVVTTAVVDSSLVEMAPAAPSPPALKGGESAKRERERQKIRQARLRASLARLRAEKLAERYYKRYGGFDEIEDSDSDLSAYTSSSSDGGEEDIAGS
jgi:hypothetical protein